jgi:hypothetical protein
MLSIFIVIPEGVDTVIPKNSIDGVEDALFQLFTY